MSESTSSRDVAGNLDSPDRIHWIQNAIFRKKSLRNLYSCYYKIFNETLKFCPPQGLAIELGSGGGFLNQINSKIVTSDIIPYPNVDRVIDATALPFENGGLRAIFMLLAFHHIPDAAAFLGEAQRCLKPGGRLVIIDQHRGWLSRWILKYVHHEAYDDKTIDWKFHSEGPLSSANGALAWIVFVRDLEKFKEKFPLLELVSYKPMTPLAYWLTGGMKLWCALPDFLFSIVSWLDRVLCILNPNFGSFCAIEVKRLEDPS